MELSVVVPVYNEQDSLRPLLEEIETALEGGPEYEVIFVDDGSEDATAERLAALKAEFRRLRVLRHRRNCGQSAAILSGVRAGRGAWIATLDGDGQNDPADILPLYRRALEEGGDGPVLVTGWRRRRRDGWLKRLSSSVANGVRRRLLGDGTPDTGCGLKIFPRDTFLALPVFDHMHRFLPALVLRAGGRVVSQEVNHRPRRRGRSKYGVLDRLWVGVVDLLGVMWLIRRRIRPQVEEVE